MPKRTRRKNTRRRVSKKNKTRKRRQRKRNKIGGSKFFSEKINKKLENLTVEGEELKKKAEMLRDQSTYWKVSPKQDRGLAQVAVQQEPAATPEPAVTPEPVATPEPAVTPEPVEPESENPLAFNILNKFFKEVEGWFGRKSYELDPTKLGPNNKMNVISSHGLSIPNKFFVVPKGLTVYLPVAAGDCFYTQLKKYPDTRNINSYFRQYKEGSLIQDYLLDFKPISTALFDSLRTAEFLDLRYKWGGEMGLLELDAPNLTVKNATEANKELISFLSHIEQLLTEQHKIDIIKDYKENLASHLSDYAHIYFKNNIDDIIDKSELILSATRHINYYLSSILNLIAEARKKNYSISGAWFCTICRSGEFIDINTFKSCQEKGLPILPEDFFKGDFHYEGIELVRHESLASSDPTINFKKILDKVFEGREQYDVAVVERVNRIMETVDLNHTLPLKDVCFIFQMKQKMVNEGKW